MADETYRDFVKTAAYLDAGPWWAVFRYLDKALAEWHAVSYAGITAAANPQRLTDVAGTFNTNQVHRLIRIGSSLHRIVAVDTVAGAWCELSAAGGPFWSPVAFDDATEVKWELLAFRLVDHCGAPATGKVYVYLPSDFDGAKPTYMQPAGALPTPIDVPRGGQIMADDSVPGDSTTQPLYIGGGAIPAISDLLRHVVLFGVHVEVISETP
jgi:hypothetical protein